MKLIPDTKLRYEIALTYFGFLSDVPGAPAHPYGYNYAGAYFYAKKFLHLRIDPAKETMIARCVSEWFNEQRTYITEAERINVQRFGLYYRDTDKMDRAILYGRVACKELFAEFRHFEAENIFISLLGLAPIWDGSNPRIYTNPAQQVYQLAEKGYDIEQISQRVGIEERYIRSAIVAHLHPELFKIAA